VCDNVYVCVCVSLRLTSLPSPPRIVKYVDKQGDLISVKTEEEFQTMIIEFGFGSTIKLQLDRKRKTNAVKDSDTAILGTCVCQCLCSCRGVSCVFVCVSGCLSFVCVCRVCV
jgi:hypothetical protein